MKKFLAILLAMMLVMVSVAAMASEGAATGGDDTTVTEGEGSEGGEGGSGSGTTAATPTAYVPGSGADAGKDTTGTPRVNAALQNGGSITLDKKFSYTLNTDVTANSKLPVSNNITFTATLTSTANTTVTIDQMADKNVTVTYTKPTAEAAVGTSPQAHGTITVQFPTYPEVGIYTYTIHESGTTTVSESEPVTQTTTETAGIGYSSDITMKVTVIRQEGELRIAGVAFRLANNNTKLGEITNTYKAGDLEVKKTVSGNMGDQNKPFSITVTFIAPANKTVGGTISYSGSTGSAASNTGSIAPSDWTIAEGDTTYSVSKTITLKHNQSVTFTNIPDGVTYTIVEDYVPATDDTPATGIKHSTSATADPDDENAYYVTGEIIDDAEHDPKAIAYGKLTTEVIDNQKDISVDTGITLETLPYVLMMALAMMGLVALKLRKREEY